MVSRKTTQRLILLTSLVIALPIVLFISIYSTTLQPKELEAVEVHCSAEAQAFDSNKPLSVLSYNVQFFAGKDYIFYFDVKDNLGPDLAPSPNAIQTSLEGIAQVIQEQQPDILLLQEVHDGAKATGYQDQLAQLISLLPQGTFPCHASAFYWQADFVPHPKIMGSVGMKLSTLSRYKLNSAQRHQLALQPMDPISQAFYLKRAILETELATEEGQPWHILNTHFDAFAKGSDTMQRQVGYSQHLLKELDRDDKPWILAGDLNLLAPGQLANLADHQHYLYQEDTELKQLFDRWPSIPSLEQLTGEDKANWYTHLANDPKVTQMDRSIDYIFHSKKLLSTHSSVLNQGKMLTLSDHMPVVARFQRLNTNN
jgi:endonuclease/exonuclease/phosphatase family metal-dependent hydrolase